MKVLITGVYGFLGFSLARKMLDKGHTVIGVDRIVGAHSDKEDRIAILRGAEGDFTYHEVDISRFADINRVFREHRPTHVMHFAAQYSLPHDTELLQRYLDSNFAGFTNVIETAKLHKVERFVYASSYLAAPEDQAWSMYSVSKAFNENCARIYSERFGMQTIGLRYGSVFGPYCRKDCAPHMLAEKLINYRPITFNERQGLLTPFLDVDDAVDLTYAVLDRPLAGKYYALTLIADDRRYTLRGLLGMMSEITGIEPRIQGTTPRNRAVGRGTDEMMTTVSVIGLRPKYSVRETTQRFLDWLGYA